MELENRADCSRRRRNAATLLQVFEGVEGHVARCVAGFLADPIDDVFRRVAVVDELQHVANDALFGDGYASAVANVDLAGIFVLHREHFRSHKRAGQTGGYGDVNDCVMRKKQLVPEIHHVARGRHGCRTGFAGLKLLEESFTGQSGLLIGHLKGCLSGRIHRILFGCAFGICLAID